MITFIGDAWLKRICQLMKEFYPDISFHFISDAAQIENNDLGKTVISYGFSRDIIPAIVAPRLYIEGLASLAIVGQKVAGASFLPEHIPVNRKTQLINLLAAGEVGFQCAQKFQQSLSEIARQCQIGAELAEFIRDKYTQIAVLSGADRPNPIVTVRAAQLIARALGLPAIISRAEPWRTDIVAYRKSTQVLLPADATELGVLHQMNPHWTTELGTVISHIYSEDGERKPSVESDTPAAIQARERLHALLIPSSNRSQMLLSASKEADKIKLKDLIDESLSNWDLISKNDRSLVIRMILKWWPLEGRTIDAAKVVLEKNPALDTITAKKIVAVGVANLGIQELSELISILENRFEFDAQMLQKLSRRRDLLLRKTQRL